MGCCNNDNCCNAEGKSKRKFPWMLIALAVVAVVVAVNWK